MKHTVIFALICTFIFITGCQTSFTPRDYGNATGISIYLGYTRVAEKQDDDFKKAAEDLWTTIQSINTYDELAESGEVEVSDPIESGLVKQLFKTLLIGGMVRFAAKELKK